MTISATTQGLRPGVTTSSNRPATPFEGQMIYETDTDMVRVWNGSAWKTVASTNGATFDSTGRMTNPVQPCFFVGQESGTTVAATNKAIFSSITTNIGSCWSSANNRFTAPVTGVYEFSYSMLNAAATPFSIEFRKNGTAMSLGTYPRGYSQALYVACVASGIIELTANDYIEMWVLQGTAHGNHCYFSGRLVS
jgi:hypothetical protein